VAWLRITNYEALKEIGEWVSSRDSIRFQTNIRSFFAVIDRVEPLLPREGFVLRRRLRDAARWAADAGDARRRHQELESDFDRLLNRAVRQRNAVIHGIRTVPEVVATVEPFVARMAANLASWAVSGAVNGRDFAETLEAERAASRQKLWRLGSSDTGVIDILYPDLSTI
jgi:hypothetical protein